MTRRFDRTVRPVLAKCPRGVGDRGTPAGSLTGEPKRVTFLERDQRALSGPIVCEGYAKRSTSLRGRGPASQLATSLPRTSPLG